MKSVYILIVDDEPAVLDVVLRELSDFEAVFPLETAQSAAEATAVIERIEKDKGRLGLILCDHMMPGQTGVEFLIDLHSRDAYRKTRKLLLTGQAGLGVTIEAINRAGLVHYIRKPWNSDELHQIVKEQMAHYLISEGMELKPYLKYLDPMIVNRAIHQGYQGDD